MDYNMDRKKRKIIKRGARSVREVIACQLHQEYAQSAVIRRNSLNEIFWEDKLLLPELDKYPNFGLISNETLKQQEEDFPELSKYFKCITELKETGKKTGKFHLHQINLSSNLYTKGHFLALVFLIEKKDYEETSSFLKVFLEKYKSWTTLKTTLFIFRVVLFF